MTDTLTTLSLDKIEVQEGFNHRSEIEVESLMRSIEQHGLLEPLVVAPNGGDTYKLIAGERRYTACCLSDAITEVPVLVREARDADNEAAERAVVAAVENLQRADLTAVEEARAVAKIKELGYRSRRQISTKLGLTEKRVKLLEEINECPAEVQQLLHEGKLPLVFAPEVAAIARVAGAELATFVTRRAVEDPRPWYLEDFKARWPELLTRGYNESEDEFAQSNPPEVFVCRADGAHVPWHLAAELVNGDVADEKLADKIEEIEAAHPWEYEPTFVKADIDAARAFGCLIEIDRGDRVPLAIVTDLEWLRDRVASAVIPRDLRTARKTVKEIEASRAEHGDPGPGQAPANESIESEAQRRGVDEDVVRAERKSQREAEAEARAEADAYNQELGRQLFERMNEVKIDNQVADYLVALIFRDNAGDIARRGLTYVHPGWRTDDELKNGKTKTTFVDTQEEAREKLQSFLADARTPEERIARALQVVFAAEFADNTVVPRSRRNGRGPHAMQDGVNFEGPKEPAMKRLLSHLTPKLRKEAQTRRDERAKSGEWNA